MKLVSLELEDFQAHEARTVKFSPSITTIIGSTDTGKSAILRALRMVCLNDLPGTHFIRDGAKRTTLTLTGRHKKENHVVVRVKNRDGSINTYSFDDRELKAFGQGMPADVDAFLRMGEINFQDQHDSPFWFKETAGEVSRRLNAVVDLSVIDTSLSNIAGAVKTAQARKDAAQERLEEAEFKQASLNRQKPRIAEFRLLEAQSDKLEKMARARDAVASLLDCIVDDLQTVQERRAQASEGSVVLTQYQERLQEKKTLSALRELIRQVKEATAAVKNTPPDFTPVVRLFNEFEQACSRLTKLTDLVRQIKRAKAQKSEWDEHLSGCSTRLQTRTKDQRCPLCGKLQ